ncbi:ATP-binding SpoIIE family protein phosphatase [Kitasatospora kifunensis]|uniref:PAS domain S-box-containing protein n=1 Tax=Kitasatospora kifunensis TaxID=58351 RepID=A0A7W7R911_KITKI|nr:SpoIIE family protein phosphatase [Kitasatospora kifunensis]MBB4927670.1 PAS domain S-box-containing protein [Kitasatospora kifunensis]
MSTHTDRATTSASAPRPDPLLLTRLRERAFIQSPFASAIYDSRNRIVGVNQELVRLSGLSEARMKGRRLRELLPYQPFFEISRLCERALRTNEPSHTTTRFRAPGQSRERTWVHTVIPLNDPSGAVIGLSVSALDITREDRARHRLALANEACTRIGATLDVTCTAQELVTVTVGDFADFAAVDLDEAVLRGEDPDLRRPGLVLRRCAQRSVLGGCPGGCPETPLLPGQPAVYPRISAQARALARGKPSLHLTTPQERTQLAPAARGHVIHSVLVVPITARGGTLGLAHFARHRQAEPFDEDDLLLAEEITARAGNCIDNARRYARERNVALALQRDLLPSRVLEQSAVETASRYLPADSQRDIGGVWFDVIPLSGARTALVVGDVADRGLNAAATMGRLRTAVRTLADLDLPPDELLTHLDGLVTQLDQERQAPEHDNTGHDSIDRQARGTGASCLYAVYDPTSRRCTIASAGHPAPLTVHPDGTTRMVPLTAGPPLGSGAIGFETVELELTEGSCLALYTAGLVTGRRAGTDWSAALHPLTGPGTSLPQTCDGLLHTLLPDPPHDDVALLIARTRTIDASRIATWDIPADPAAVARARHHATERLAAWGLEELAFTTELVVTELVTNAIRYGASPIRLRLIRDRRLICEVSDASGTSPRLRRAKLFDEGGRGLLLVAQLTERWGTRFAPEGKIIWTEQDLTEPAAA